jgi:hypothetical protein
MSVQAKVRHCDPCERSYPWIGVEKAFGDHGMVVLFSAPGRGIALRPAIGCDVVCGWDMCRFEAFCGEVCLSNCGDRCRCETKT